nr:protein kinase family protein [Alloactinosynnema sp. L-07]
MPGGVVGDGRYRLTAQFGVDGRTNAHLWRAQDGQLRRDVALTLLVGDPGDAQACAAARRTLERAAHAAALTHPGKARVLDVLGQGSGIGAGEGLIGIIVADWTPGTDLVDLVAERPLPAEVAARLLGPLASASELAHHTGLVLGVDHPQRIRVTTDGALRLSFPGPSAEATLQDDVRGLGAVLYLLLTNRWPLPGGPAGVLSAPVNPDGSVVAPRALFPHIPHELSAAALRCLSGDAMGGIQTSAGLIRVLDRFKAFEEETQQFQAITDDYDDDGTVWTTRRPSNDRAQRRKLAIGVTALAVATVGVLAWVGMQLISFFGDTAPGVGGPTVVATAPGGGSGGPPPPQAGDPIQSAGVRVFNLPGKGTPDNAKRANRAVDGDQKTAWKTDIYKEQFPSLKPGVGIMASFAEPVMFAEVVVDSPSDGTVIEIRTAPSDRPGSLDETKVIGKSEPLKAGQTKIQLAKSEPTQHLLIWITTLGEGNVSELTEIAFVRAR